MKTADLIPFILLELNECDKYGFELTKAIETKSNGYIIIKQPTLYTLLKKLEKSKFITSYWQDSEIGGKRHYYKLTENGRMQVSTLPSYDFLLKNITSSTDSDDNDLLENANPQLENKTSIMDELLNNPIPTPNETVLPTDEVFSEINLDSSTELDINVSNVQFLKDEKVSIDETFAINKDVSKFTEKVVAKPTTVNQTSINNSTPDVFDCEFSIPNNEKEIKFVDYVDLKNNEKYKYSKTISSKMLLQTLATSLTLLCMAILCSIITKFTGRSGLYYFFFISALLIALFYPIIYILNMEKMRLKYQSEIYNLKTKIKLYIGISILLAVLIVCIIVSVALKKTTIISILSVKNFANFYAPILLTSIYFIDVLYNHLILSKIKL